MEFDTDSKTFWEPDDLGAKLRQVYDVCHGCRRCLNLCPSFNVMFDRIDASETGLTILGLILVVQRHRIARWYCIVLLTLYSLARLGEALLGVEPVTPALFLVTGIAWLVYWLFGEEPRALALGRFWTRREGRL